MMAENGLFSCASSAIKPPSSWGAELSQAITNKAVTPRKGVKLSVALRSGWV
jgi:hypothetical protein